MSNHDQNNININSSLNFPYSYHTQLILVEFGGNMFHKVVIINRRQCGKNELLVHSFRFHSHLIDCSNVHIIQCKGIEDEEVTQRQLPRIYQSNDIQNQQFLILSVSIQSEKHPPTSTIKQFFFVFSYTFTFDELTQIMQTWREHSDWMIIIVIMLLGCI